MIASGVEETSARGRCVSEGVTDVTSGSYISDPSENSRGVILCAVNPPLVSQTRGDWWHGDIRR